MTETTDTNNYLLSVENIDTYIGQFHILEGVSVNVAKGSITVLLGRNGAGKTTTLKTIMGLTPPRNGKVIFDDQEIQGKRAFNIANLGIGYVPENRAIFRALTVMENLKLAERKKGDLDRHADFIFELFPDLSRLSKLKGNQLSGGQQQRVSIARALMNGGDIILADEPTGALDSKSGLMVMQILQDLHREGHTIILVTHEEDIARHAHRIIRLRDGVIESDERNKDVVQLN